MGSADRVTQATGLQTRIFWLAFKVGVQGVAYMHVFQNLTRRQIV